MTTSPAAGATLTDAQIGNRIIQEAAARGVSIQEISDATPLSYPTLLKSLTGERSLKIRELGVIASTLGVTTAALVQVTPDQKELTAAKAA
jgi:transcriptional regulator with XRE-family HTH domain